MQDYPTLAYVMEAFTGTGGDIVGQIKIIWTQLKAPLVVPLLTISLTICLVMSIMLFIERVYMGLVTGYIKLFRKPTRKRYKFEPFKDDIELGSSVYPLVLVQVPMFNEKEVYRLSIGAACELTWPSDRIVIQVLDDSTDPIVKGVVQVECQKWASKGKNIHYQVRDNRKGYKAGALKEGLKHQYANQCEYVAIFDADFQPEPDFLLQTIPYHHHNPELGLVQTRWKFGTAGVWRMAAIEGAGGWQDRTTVEDMDLAVRATLKGWKFLYLGNIKVKSELPSTFKAFRYQQHRWSCGPANLFRKMVFEIIRNKRVTLWKKLYVIYSFFFVRKIIAHIVTFTLYCVVLPMAILVPEVAIPKWGSVYIPITITLLNAVATPRFLCLQFY
ncbi:nucleotide-diphospho-sugar transferase [Artemisia annua]|uniref:Nucleotide-diphospho-sugar transferase n=1 Tax=Artemisia annua TaxID=35608 RepID=A0A2U1LCU1_ARTAN|nr:nucleotide-diphospho-sugar transferase [Artemisia annua]